MRILIRWNIHRGGTLLTVTGSNMKSVATPEMNITQLEITTNTSQSLETFLQVNYPLTVKKNVYPTIVYWLMCFNLFSHVMFSPMQRWLARLHDWTSHQLRLLETLQLSLLSGLSLMVTMSIVSLMRKDTIFLLLWLSCNFRRLKSIFGNHTTHLTNSHYTLRYVWFLYSHGTYGNHSL